MFTLDEIKEAILKISDAEILSNDEDERESRVRFKKMGTFLLLQLWLRIWHPIQY